MSEDPDKLALDVVGELLELPPDERAGRVASLSNQNPPLHDRVVSLLRELSDVAESTTPADFFEPTQPAAAPMQVGKYRIIQRIGGGGMGEVFEAEQERPKRRVALKLLRAVRFTGSMLRRFEYEAEWLARLDHPGIARVYEAGTAATQAGLVPFFAMELVEGLRLDRWLESTGSGLRDRVRLLVEICQAVQHAHQKGLIHRDLKPANIQVTRDNRPKILDFGVARALGDSPDARQSLMTSQGTVIGTVQYMSPEQAAGDVAQLDTRTDVYSLGVIAYQVLSGKVPYEVGTISLPSAIRVINETDPPPLGRADRRLRGDLETIVCKAMEKRKEDRYASAGEMSADLQGYLMDQPISARPHGIGYSFRKFARRRRGLVIAATIILLTMVLAIAVTSTALVREHRARAAEIRQHAVAERAGDAARKVNEFLTELLSSADPEIAQGREFTVREMLDKAATEIPGKFANQPEAEALIRGTIAGAYAQLGRPLEALPHARRAVELTQSQPDGDPAARRRARSQLAATLVFAGKAAEGEAISREIVAECTRQLGPDALETLNNLSTVAAALNYQNRFDEATVLYRQICEGLRRTLGEDDAQTLFQAGNLASQLNRVGLPREGEALARQVAERAEKKFGPLWPTTLAALQVRCSALQDLGRFNEAAALLTDIVARNRKVFGPTHRQTVSSLNDLAMLLARIGRADEAEPYIREALAGSRKELGDDHAETLLMMSNLGYVLDMAGRDAQAIPILKECLDRRTRVLGPDHAQTLTTMNNLGGVLEDSGDIAGAEPLYRAAALGREKLLGASHPQTLRAWNNLAGLLADHGRAAEAEPIMEKVYRAMAGAQLAPDERGKYCAEYGLCLLDLGKFDRAEPLLIEAREQLLGSERKRPELSAKIDGGLIEIYEKTNRAARAAELRAESATQPTTSPTSRPTDGRKKKSAQ